jgi:Protein of unknown function (DUF2752)
VTTARALRAPLATGAAVLAAWTAVALADLDGGTVLCPLRALTGLDCPLCGGTRAAHDLAHGDLAGAAGHNLVVAMALPLAVVLWARWTWRRAHGEDVPLVRLGSAQLVVALGVLLGFALVRNLPVAAPLASG